MLFNLCYLFILFIIYSIIGYVSEVISISNIEKKLIFNRGFLIGPYIPIFGIGGLFMTIFLDKYKNDIFVLFIASMISCLVIEYLGSILMEKLFKLRWWDYSDRKFNIDGRICLENGILFGIAGVLVIKLLFPFLKSMLDQLSNNTIIIIGIILMVIFVTDLIISNLVTIKLKNNFDDYDKKDATADIKQLMKQEIKRGFLANRLLKAFPDIRDLHNVRLNVRHKVTNRKHKS